MAEETTSATSDQQLSQIINQLLAGKTAQPAVDPNAGPSSREGRGILSLLGEGLGGGAQYGSTQEREQGGLSALGAAGARMLQASDWSVMPHSFGSILGQGLDAARGNLGHTQAVSAAQHYAAQQMAHEQQQDQIARLKEALPYLQLQEDQRAAARQRELLRPGSTNTSIGAAGGPPDPGSPAGQVATRTAAFWSSQGYTPEQVAGIMAGGPGAESGFDPGAKGDGGTSLGLYQHHADRMAELVKRYGPNPTEAQQHEFAAWEISPQGTHAAVGAALKQAKTPQEAAAIWTKGFENPKNADAVAAARASVAGRYVGYGQAPAKAGAPATPAAPGQATMPSPEPPLLAGTAQTAGPAGPTSDVIPPSPPGSDATVAEIEAGRASSPARTGAPQPGAVVTAQAGGQPTSAAQLPPIPIAGGVVVAHPGVYKEYFAREAAPPPNTEDFNPSLTARQNAAFAHEAAAIEERARANAARVKPDPKETADILAARQEIKAKVELAAQDKAQKAAVNLTKWADEQEKAVRPRYEQQIKSYDAAATAMQAQSHKMQEIAATATEARATEAAKQEGQVIVEERKKMAETRDAARQSIDQVHVLRALSDRAGTATALENITLPNGQTIRDVMVQHGLGDEKTLAHLNSQQAYEVAATQMVMDLRKGVQMGNLSDGDLRFLQKVVPKGSITPEGRADMLATIELIHDRKREYIDRVHQLWDQGKGLSWEKAKVEADKQMGDIVPQVPQEYKAMSDQERDVWWKANTKPRMLLRTPDELNKDGKVTKRGHIIMVPEAPQ